MCRLRNRLLLGTNLAAMATMAGLMKASRDVG